MAVVGLEFQVRSGNAVSETKKLTTATQQLESAVQSNIVKLRDSNGRFIKAGESAAQASKGVDQLTAGIKRLASQLALAEVARRYFKGFNEAEQAAAAVRTLGVDSQALQQRLLSLSNSLGGLYSQTQLVSAAYDVASSGFADTASNAKVLEAAAYGATGGLSDINTVGNAVTSVLNAYGKSADEAGKLVDGFIQTQNDGKIILNEYATQIGRLAPTAAASGVGIQELNAAIATITAQGVPVEATFTGLNQALVSILKPSKEAEDLAKGLGIQFNEAGLKAKGFGGLLQEVKQKTGGSTTALVELFGSVDAVKAVLPLTNDNLVSFNKNLDRQANATGVAKDATKELGGTVSSQITKMVNQIGNLARALDQVLGPTLGSLIGLINIVIAKASEGIMVLGQMFSMNKNTAILKTAIESGDVGTSAPGRVLPGAAELIGEKRTRQLQQQAGGFGKFDSKKFTELLAQQPEIKKLLGTDKPAETKPNATGGLTAAQQAALDKLLQGGGSGRTRKKGKTDEERAAEKAAKEAARLAEETKKQLADAFKLNDLAAANLDIQVSMNAEERLKGEFDKAAVERRMQFLELQKNAKSQQERELLASAQLSEVLIANNKYAKDKKTLLDQQLKPLEDIIAANKTKLEDDKAYQRLVAEGINPELAKQYIEIDRAGKALQEALQPAIDLAKVAVVEAEARGASADEVARLRKELEGLQQLPGQKAEEARKGAEAANKPKTFQEGIAGERDKVKKDLEELTNLTNVVNFGAKTIGDSFAASFKGIISGTMGAKEALASFFQSVADAFLDMAAQIIAKWIQMTILNSVLSIFPGGGNLANGFGGASNSLGAGATGSFSLGSQFSAGNVFGFANGGVPPVGRPSIVGERGPELFMPGIRGTVIPNNALGGGSTSVVVNVDASGNSNVQGDQAQAKQLGVVVSAAVQAELVKQQRPGGLLAGTRR